MLNFYGQIVLVENVLQEKNQHLIGEIGIVVSSNLSQTIRDEQVLEVNFEINGELIGYNVRLRDLHFLV